MVASYTVWQGGRADTRELVYRFAEDVFDPEDPGALNLASMITAQVAVNYGLFSKRIIFHGAFDGADRKFLRQAAAITARDIYVRKLLRPKPFYTSWVEQIPVVQRESYLLARIRFPGEKPAAVSPWKGDPSRAAVLASGGKDSLLSHQLLAECGCATHSIFVNEAGKHWFTALNAYRHFNAEVEHTARVWTNSDRLFSWLLRHLPFVKKDFARYGWNGYPIRVWTVPVFLFGTLPLLARRGIGQLAVGNEYDTSLWGECKGIPNYFCLYDQSREFEFRLNKYLQRKQWGVQVLSVLRPLSGLLIQKILARRYPNMLPLQMSCHRTRSGGDRMLPCGSCEKCVGVMAVLTAFGEDPAVCGYTPQQIEHCLRELPTRSTWQEEPALEHLAFLLSEQGLLPQEQVGGHGAVQRPEVMKLRFDGEAAGLGDLPSALRRRLFPLLLEEAEGAVWWDDNAWHDFDLLAKEESGCPDSD